mgnify:FL=1
MAESNTPPPEEEKKENPDFDDLSVERQRTVMQSFMMYNVEAFAGFSAGQTTGRFVHKNTGYEKV